MAIYGRYQAEVDFQQLLGHTESDVSPKLARGKHRPSLLKQTRFERS